ncbi:helix-turn-helix domain-containing protein [Oribacterium sp. WCC10]|uniref:helix-turn-helix domain-containing protein n=1 Tax=Oribacterium sp. WCC10 TaxID=1855343 RepID=UPI0008DEBCE3|nr:helix-turn-helix domain-containing protein [Oribacterium sp. WCC10]SFG63766.1 PucR C-terminal helix-turn-helix domain-containing protein [Oribacterium sp. WCC10]
MMRKEDLFEIIVHAKTLEEYVEACAKYIRNPLWIMDVAYRILARSFKPSSTPFIRDFEDGKTMERVDRWVSSGLLEKVSGNRKPVRLHDSLFDKDVVIMDIFSGNNSIGKLTIVEQEPVTDDEVIHISEAAEIYLRMQSRTSGSTLEQGLALLLQDTPESESTGRKILESAGYTGKPPYHIIKADTSVKDRSALLSAFLVDIKNMDPMLLCGVISNQCYILTSEGHDVPQKHLRKDIRLGVSLPFDCLHLLKAYAVQADVAIRNGSGSVEYFRDYYNAYMRECLSRDIKDTSPFIIPEIREILRYDKEYKTDYFKTLDIYVHNMCSKQNTADKMGIHLNTVKYRVSQLEKVFDIDFGKPDEIFISIFAFKEAEKQQAGID